MSTPVSVDQLPTIPKIVRYRDAETTALGPSSTFRLLFGDQAGAPEFFCEESGQGDGAPLHRHPWATWELVLEGHIRFRVGEEEHELGPGDAIYTPPNTPHTYKVVSKTAKAVGINYPARRFFDLQRKAAPLFNGPGGPDLGAIMALAAEHDVEVLGPPLE